MTWYADIVFYMFVFVVVIVNGAWGQPNDADCEGWRPTFSLTTFF